jgi:copper chaperone NosL
MNSRLIVLSVLAQLLGCAAADAPVDPVWGKQPCDHCHMLLSDPSSAAQIVTQHGDRLHFDDVGCMVEHLSSHASDVSRAWVRDAHGRWLAALHAHYRGGAATPMGYGIAADERGELDFKAVQRAIAQHELAGNAP